MKKYSSRNPECSHCQVIYFRNIEIHEKSALSSERAFE